MKMLAEEFRDGNSMSKDEVSILLEALEEYDIKSVLEIGTYRGYVTFGMHEWIVEKNHGKIVSVDVIEDTEGWDAAKHKDINERNLKHIERNCLRNIRLYTCGSDDYFAEHDDIFDCVIIDGDHSYVQVKKDLENAFRCVKQGGLVILHDYDKDEIRQCVAETDVPFTHIRATHRLGIIKKE